METRKDLVGENLSNLFCSSTWLQLLHLMLCRSLPVDRAFRLTQTDSDCIKFAGQYV